VVSALDTRAVLCKIKSTLPSAHQSSCEAAQILTTPSGLATVVLPWISSPREQRVPLPEWFTSQPIKPRAKKATTCIGEKHTLNWGVQVSHSYLGLH